MPHNISLQRTAPCGLAAELGSFGALAVIGVLAMILGAPRYSYSSPSFNDANFVSISAENWAVKLYPEGRAEVGIIDYHEIPANAHGTPLVDPSNQISDRHFEVNRLSPVLRELLSAVYALDPAPEGPQCSSELRINCFGHRASRACLPLAGESPLAKVYELARVAVYELARVAVTEIENGP
jgi:hypothetical protein